MSSSLKRPTSSRPTDHVDSSDEEVQLTVQSSPRYDFRYPRLSPIALPAFEDHPFWQVGMAISRKVLTAGLHKGLLYVRLAVSTLDASKLIPKDISLCLVSVFTMTQFANDQDEEWSEFVFPDYSADPPACHPNNAQPPLAPRDPTLDELQAAPSLMKLTQMPPPTSKCWQASTPRVETKVEPPKDGAPPSKRSRNTKVVPQPALKTVAKLLKTLPIIKTKLKEIGDSKPEIGWAAFLPDNFIVTIAVSRKQGTAIPYAHSHVGVTSTHRKSKATDYTMALWNPCHYSSWRPSATSLWRTRSSYVPPLIGCTPCNLLRIKCQPNGGVTCQSCSYKKMGAICDHTMDTVQFATLMHDLAEKATFSSPPCLKHATNMVAAARKSFVLVHGEFYLHLHICAIRNQGDVLGKEGFRTLFKDLKEDEDVAAAFNTLIGHYNASLPKSSRVFKVGDEEDAISELDIPTPKADPGGSLILYNSNEEVDTQPPKKPVTCAPTKSPQKQRESLILVVPILDFF
ncbi:hypothetical protein K438DRAFT_1977248 [Mycena galopus ATCC 62051]|nr:hypothetical protein K438DRAFT_1977248 [Mycena galopus ATCC 62051]